MAGNKRRTYTSAQKAANLRRHHRDKILVSQVCEEAGIRPSIFHDWQRKALENLEQALNRQDSQRERELERRIAALEASPRMAGATAFMEVIYTGRSYLGGRA